MREQQQGFTLLEVLVAALILFLVVVTTMNIYRGALLSSRSASDALIFSENVLLIRSQISQVLHDSSSLDRLEDSGQYANIGYAWRADLHVTGLPYHPDNLPMDEVISLGENSPQGATPVRLWRVEMNLLYNDKQRTYEFWEMTW